jgi:hypothetical protein
MKSRVEIPNVGAIDPRLKTSPVAEEMAEEADTLGQQVTSGSVCVFNGEEFSNGAFVRSGSTILKCSNGLWIETGAELDV